MKLKQQFLTYLLTEKGRSQKTIENYDRYLTRFFSVTKATTVSHLTEKRIERFRLNLLHSKGRKTGNRVEPMKQTTQNYHFIALRVFLKFLQQKEIRTLQPGCIALGSKSENSIEVLSFGELERFLQAPDNKSLEGLRDRALLSLIILNGLRTRELCSLLITDIDFSQSVITVPHPIGTPRTIAISEATRKSLKAYLTKRADMSTVLFLRHGRKSRSEVASVIHPRLVQRAVKRYATQVGIHKEVTPQLLRQSAAAASFSRGGTLSEVQRFLGHAHARSTKAYEIRANDVVDNADK